MTLNALQRHAHWWQVSVDGTTTDLREVPCDWPWDGEAATLRDMHPPARDGSKWWVAYAAAGTEAGQALLAAIQREEDGAAGAGSSAARLAALSERAQAQQSAFVRRVQQEKERLLRRVRRRTAQRAAAAAAGSGDETGAREERAAIVLQSLFRKHLQRGGRAAAAAPAQHTGSARVPVPRPPALSPSVAPAFGVEGQGAAARARIHADSSAALRDSVLGHAARTAPHGSIDSVLFGSEAGFPRLGSAAAATAAAAAVSASTQVRAAGGGTRRAPVHVSRRSRLLTCCCCPELCIGCTSHGGARARAGAVHGARLHGAVVRALRTLYCIAVVFVATKGTMSLMRLPCEVSPPDCL